MNEIELRALRIKLICRGVELIKEKINKVEKERITEASMKAASYPLPGPEDVAIEELENVVVAIARKYDLDTEVIKIVDNWSFEMLQE